jgi:hypothetical protein
MILYTTLLSNVMDSGLYNNVTSTTSIRTIINRGVRKAVSDIDFRSTIRKSSLSPNLFSNIYQYSSPTDLKADRIIDVMPQINRNRHMSWDYVTTEEFDRYKAEGSEFSDEDFNVLGDYPRNLLAISNDDMVRKLLLSMEVSDTGYTIDSLNSVEDWIGFGDGENLIADSDNYVKGNASINFDINDDGGTTAGIENSNLPTFDLTDYLSTGSAFVWTYISDTTNITNYILRLGSDSSNYYYITVTTTNEGVSFENGWNLLRFDMNSKTETGSVDDDNCSYCALYMTKDAGKTDETDYRFNNLIIQKGVHFSTKYYSKYPWITNLSVRIENSTADTDYLMADSDEEDILVEACKIELFRDLKDYDQMKLAQAEYIKLKDNYLLRNPSQALLLTSRYWDN